MTVSITYTSASGIAPRTLEGVVTILERGDNILFQTHQVRGDQATGEQEASASIVEGLTVRP
jgi:hypothetical protein